MLDSEYSVSLGKQQSITGPLIHPDNKVLYQLLFDLKSPNRSNCDDFHDLTTSGSIIHGGIYE